VRRILSKLQNYYDRRRIIKLGQVCGDLVNSLGISVENFLQHTGEPVSSRSCGVGQTGKHATDNQAPSPSVKIFQVYYRPEQRTSLDPAFEPYDWLCNPYPEYTETLHFINLHQSGKYREADYVGIVSNKFGLKTGLTGERFIQFIRNHPGYDVYFVNPFPELGYSWLNVWSQGEFRHAGLTALALQLFEATRTPVRIDSLGRNSQNSLLYCNYWIGNEKFWDAFMSFLTPLFRWIDQGSAPHERKPYFRTATYADTGFSMFSFIFERLFSTFLLINQDIAGLGYRFSNVDMLAKCGNVAYRNFISMFGAFIDRLDQLSLRRDNLGMLSLELLRELMTLKTDDNCVARFRTELNKL
jgi:hypothetical protein